MGGGKAPTPQTPLLSSTPNGKGNPSNTGVDTTGSNTSTHSHHEPNPPMFSLRWFRKHSHHLNFLDLITEEVHSRHLSLLIFFLGVSVVVSIVWASTYPHNKWPSPFATDVNDNNNNNVDDTRAGLSVGFEPVGFRDLQGRSARTGWQAPSTTYTNGIQNIQNMSTSSIIFHVVHQSTRSWRGMGARTTTTTATTTTTTTTAPTVAGSHRAMNNKQRRLYHDYNRYQRRLCHHGTCKAIPRSSSSSSHHEKAQSSVTLLESGTDVIQNEVGSLSVEAALTLGVIIVGVVMLPIFKANRQSRSLKVYIVGSLTTLLVLVLSIWAYADTWAYYQYFYYEGTLQVCGVVALALVFGVLTQRSVAVWRGGRYQHTNVGFPQQRAQAYHNLVHRLLKPIHRQDKVEVLLQDEHDVARVAAELSGRSRHAETGPTRWQVWRRRLVFYLWSGPMATRVKESFRSKVNYHQLYETKTDFYYPQRVLFGYLFSTWFILTVALGFLYQTIPLAKGVIDVLYDNDRFSYDTYKILRPLVLAGIVLATLIGQGLNQVLWWYMLRQYRKQIMLLRQGKYFFERKAFTLVDVSRFVGYSVSHSVFSFLLTLLLSLGVITFIVVLILDPETKRDFVAALWLGFKTVIVSAAVITYVQRLVIRFVFTTDDGTLFRFRNVYAYIDYILIFVNIVQGLAVIATRILWGIVRTLVYSARMDVSLFPRGSEASDGSYQAWIAVLLTDHTYNNPVASVFVDILCRDMKLKRTQHANTDLFNANALAIDTTVMNRRRLVRNRWHLLYTLHHNRSLLPLRNHALAVERSLQRAKDKQRLRLKKQGKLAKSEALATSSVANKV